MRVSGISRFLGGADNVNAREVIQGDQLVFSGTIQDENGNPIDITAFDIDTTTEFYTVNLSESGRNVTVSSFDPITPTHSASVAVSIVAGEAAMGKIQMTIPHDLYGDEIGLDINTDVPTAVTWVRISDKSISDPTAHAQQFRLLTFIRRGPLGQV